MNLNNKGMSLMELLVSIILIGIVLTFLFQLLVDLRGETDNNDYAYNNQVNRTEAIYTIEQDLSKYVLLGIEDKSSDNNIILNFYYKKGNDEYTAILETTNKTSGDVTKHYLKYTNVAGEKYSWEMKGATINPCGLFTFYKNTASENYYFKINIYLYNGHERNNKVRNNAVDDIEITYAGITSDLNTTTSSYLTYNEGIKNIGTCTE